MLFLLCFGTLGLISCSQLMFWKSVSKEEIRQAEEYLVETIDALVEIDPADDPEKYHENRVVFERALAAYLAATGKHDRSLVHIDYRGANILIPVRRIGYHDDFVEVILADTVSQMWQSVGPVFRDDIVDITVIQENESYFVATLFPDSLAAFSINDPESTLLIFNIPSDYRGDIRSQKPAGMIERDNNNKLYFITTHLNTACKLDINEHPVEYEYPIAISPVAGMPYFSYGHEGINNIFAVRKIADDDRTILLDNRGFLYLKSNDDDTFIWRSERSWGDRLFRVDDNRFAVSHPYENLFVLFEVQPDRIDVKGVSPRFYGSIGAVAGIVLADRKGFLVSITTGKQSVNRYSRLYFVPEDFIRWRDPEVIPQPLFPDYDSHFVVADNIGYIFDRAYIEGNLSQVAWNNIYETLMRYSSDGEPEYNLATSITSDEDRRQWTVHLKPDIRFSNGTYLSSGIVRSSWKRNFEECSKNVCPLNWLSENIENIQIVDDLTFIIYLDRSLPNFLEHLTAPCFQIAKESDTSRWPLGTGPYVITDTDRPHSPRSVSGSRNPFYHGGLPPFVEVIFIERRTNIIDYLVNRVDAGALVRNPRVVDFFGGIDDFKELKAGNRAIYFLALNPGSPRLRSGDSRDRIINAFERQAVETVVTEARSELAVSFFNKIEIHEREVRNSSTLPGENSLRMYYARQDPVAEQIAQRLAVRLQQAGISAQPPTGLSLERMRQIRINGHYDILIDSFLPGFLSTAYNMYDLLHRGFLFDEHLKQMSEELLLSEGDNNVAAIEQYLEEQRYLYTLIRTSLHAIVPRKLNDVEYPDVLVLDLSRAWFPKQ